MLELGHEVDSIMGKRLSLAEHLSVDELEARYRQCNHAGERSRWQILWLLATGYSSHEVSQVTGYSLHWIRALARRYNQHGPESMDDGRRYNPGKQPLLNDEQQAYLVQALEGPAPGGGRWSGPKVAQWMSQLLSRPVAPQRGWEYLRAAEYRLKVPRPQNLAADIHEQDQWKKTFPIN